MATGRAQVVLEFIGDDSRLVKTLRNVESASTKTLGVVGKLGLVGGAASSLLSVANAGSTLYGALTLVAPAALALPGILAGGIVAMQTWKLATAGFADAVKGDAEAMAKLPPAAQNAVKAVKSMESGWQAMQRAVQQEFFKGLAPEIKATGTELLDVGTKGLPKVATGFNGMLSAALTAARTPFFTGSLTGIINNTAGAVTNMRGTLANALLGFVGLGSVGAQYLPAIGAWIDKIAAGFARWVTAGTQDGSIKAMIDTALEGFRQIWELLKALGTAVGTFATGINSGLGAGVTPLTLMTDKLQLFNSILESPKGQETLYLIGAAIRAISDAFNAVLPYLLEFAMTLAGVVLPAVIGLANIIADNGQLFAGLIIGIVGVVAVVKTLLGIVALVRAAIVAWTAVQWLLNIAMSANPIGLIILAVVALIAIVALIIANWETVSAFFVGLWESIVTTFQSNVETVKNFFVGLWQSIVTTVESNVATVVAFFVGLWQSIVSTVESNVAAVVGFFVGLWQSIVTTVESNVATVVGLFQGFVSWITGLWDSFVAMNRTAWNNFLTTIQNIVNNVVTWVRDKINGFVNFFKSIDLVASGRAIIDGFRRGLSAAWDSMVSWFQSQLAWFRGLWPFSPAKWGPFSGRGYVTYSGKALVDDFAGSLAKGVPAVASAARGLMSAAQTGMSSSGSGESSAMAELARHLAGGGQVFEDLSFPGMSANMAAFNDAIGDRFWSANRGLDWSNGGQSRLSSWLGGQAAGSGGGGGTAVRFEGNIGDELATLIMRLIRTGKIQLRAA